MNGRNIILAVLLATQLGVGAYMSLTKTKAPAASEVRFFDGAVDQVVKAVITDRENKTLTLKKENGLWVINPPDNFPANIERITSRLKQLTTMKSDRLVSHTKGSQARLRVGDEVFNSKIELVDGNDHHTTIFLGSSQGSNGIHVRKGGSDLVYFVTGISVWDFAPNTSQWWQNRLVDVGADDVVALDLKNGQGSLSLKRDKDGNWKDAGQEEATLNQDKVKELIDQARTVTITDYLSQKEIGDSKEQSVVTVTLTVKDDAKISFEIGVADDKKICRIVKTGDKQIHPATISKANVEELFSATGDQLVAAKHVEVQQEKEPVPVKSETKR